jgi:tetratricopeptide (TPR) repeat protein/transcriptional regulator with XRE-family HTH domain
LEAAVFADLVQDHRRRLGLTQEELSARTGISARTIGRLEGGQIQFPRASTVRLLADVFGLADEDRDRFYRSARDGEADVVTRIPAQLPPDVSAFTGRAAELAWLDRVFAGIAAEPTALVISAVSGTPGVGKTALAIHWSQRSRFRFPDGQLYLNLRGYDPDSPMNPHDALGRLLGAFGLSARDIPAALDDRAARYRTEMADRRVLLVLDNASSADQVQPLLPGTPSCVVLVTSRDSLGGLVAVNGARRLDLDLLPGADAVALLRRLIGSRVEDEPGAAWVLVEQCARLPVALRVAAELAVSRPELPLAALVAELTDRRTRLRRMSEVGGPHGDVRTVFSWSIGHLTPAANRLFRLLGVHPGTDVDGYAAAALAGTDVESARGLLAVLARAGLVTATGADRYGMHDLLRSYAAELGADDAPAALGRLFDYYVAAAAVAIARVYPAEVPTRLRIGEAAAAIPDFGEAAAARAWLDHERVCLTAAAANTGADGWPDRAISLSLLLFRYLDGSHFADAVIVHSGGRDAARRIDDPAGEAGALLGLGCAELWQGDHDAALGHLQQGLAPARRAGDTLVESRLLNGLGVVHRRLGNYAAAADRQRQALALARSTGERVSEARALSNLGIAEHLLGRHDVAAASLERALAVFEQIGDRTGQAGSQHNLGNAELLLGRLASAQNRLEAALALYRQLGHVRGEAATLDSLGVLHTRLGRPDDAVELHHKALVLFRESGESTSESSALNGLGEATVKGGDPAAAVAHFTAALASAGHAGDRHQQARAHAGLGSAYRRVASFDRVRHHYHQALHAYDALGSADAVGVRAALAELGSLEAP